jgi:hypothetical protein
MARILSAFAAGLCILTFTLGAHAASDEYKAAKKQADADYLAAKADCKKQTGTDKKACLKQAKGDHEATEEKIKSMK